MKTKEETQTRLELAERQYEKASPLSGCFLPVKAKEIAVLKWFLSDGD